MAGDLVALVRHLGGPAVIVGHSIAASTRVVGSIAAVLRGYGVTDAEMDHAIRTLRCTLHGYAVLHATGGFQWSGDPDETFDWMIRFLDRGLRATRPPAAVTGG